jgi:ribosome modulation factor
MDLTDEQRKKIFEEGKQAAMRGQSRRACPYLSDETPERIYLWIAGFDAFRP